MILSKKDRVKCISENFSKYNKISYEFNISNEDIKFLDKFESIYNKLHSNEIKEFYENAPLAHRGRTHKERYKSLNTQQKKTNIINVGFFIKNIQIKC